MNEKQVESVRTIASLIGLVVGWWVIARTKSPFLGASAFFILGSGWRNSEEYDVYVWPKVVFYLTCLFFLLVFDVVTILW